MTRRTGLILGKDDIPKLLAAHRKRVVKEIREAIKGVWDNRVFMSDSKSMLQYEGFENAKEAILSLPELKEDDKV